MAGQEAREYEVIFTRSGEIRFYEIIEYLYTHYSFERAVELTEALYEAPETLSYNPEKGSKEERLSEGGEYRYILFRRTQRAMIKIIYYIDKKSKTVYVTDFFPSEMNPNRMNKGRK